MVEMTGNHLKMNPGNVFVRGRNFTEIQLQLSIFRDLMVEFHILLEQRHPPLEISRYYYLY